MKSNIDHGRAAAVLLACLAGFALLGSACGSSGNGSGATGVATVGPGQATSAPTGSGADNGQRPSDQEIYDGLLKYSKCMRQHGVTNFPDPELGKGLQVNGNDVGADTATYKSADNACKSLMPAGGAADNAPVDRAAALKYSQCMRENGVTKFPDPNPDGGISLDGDKIGMPPDNPVFQAAEKACKKFMGDAATQQNG
jgi:hypothetical protein